MSTEYEQQRLKNIERNQALLSKLGIKKLVEDEATQKKPKKELITLLPEEVFTRVRRKSLRTTANEKPVYNYEKFQRERQKAERLIAAEEKKALKESLKWTKTIRSEQRKSKARSKKRRYESEEEESAESEEDDESEEETNNDSSNSDLEISQEDEMDENDGVIRTRRRNTSEEFGSDKRTSSRLIKKPKIDYKSSSLHVFTTDNHDLHRFSIKRSRQRHPVVMFTGVPFNRSHHTTVQQLGGTVEESDVSKVTHLITDGKLRRTIKILCGINICSHIVSLDWIVASQLAKTFLDEKNYIITDPEVDVVKSLSNARKRKLFKEMRFFVTPNTNPGPSQMASVIESAGGTIVKNVKDFDVDDEEEVETFDKNKIVIVTCEKDQDFCEKKIKNVSSVQILNVEKVIEMICHQELLVEKKEKESDDESNDDNQSKKDASNDDDSDQENEEQKNSDDDNSDEEEEEDEQKNESLIHDGNLLNSDDDDDADDQEKNKDSTDDETNDDKKKQTIVASSPTNSDDKEDEKEEDSVPNSPIMIDEEEDDEDRPSSPIFEDE
ncbi:Mdc1 [Acrasis kona]|uniref:Mdc1 n=1 Tax=Acrasis kona TaxID=1008807 RepID=A0AAW2Z3R0_9EUKA